MTRLLRILRIIIALMTISLLAVLTWHCIDIYSSHDATALHAVFTMEDVAARLHHMGWLFLLYGVVVMAILVIQMCQPTENQFAGCKCNHHYACQKSQLPLKTLFHLRAAMFVLIFIFILLGIFNGGMYDVLVKAINICTECIGLG